MNCKRRRQTLTQELGCFLGVKNFMCRPPPPPWNQQPLLHPCTSPLLRAQPSPLRRQKRRRRRRASRWRRRRAAAAERHHWFPRPMSQRTLALWSWGAQGAQLYQFECILGAYFCLIGRRKPKWEHCDVRHDTSIQWCNTYTVSSVIIFSVVTLNLMWFEDGRSLVPIVVNASCREYKSFLCLHWEGAVLFFSTLRSRDWHRENTRIFFQTCYLQISIQIIKLKGYMRLRNMCTCQLGKDFIGWYTLCDDIPSHPVNL